MTQVKHQTTTSTVVLYPTSSVGHLSPTVELAKLFLAHDFNITIILVDPPSSSISSITSSNPSISFHYLTPLITTPSLPPSTHPLIHFFHVVSLNNHLLVDYLTRLSETTCVSALILDFFCFPALDVAEELRIPSFFFFSSNASVLSASLRLPSLLPQLPTPLKDLGDSPLHFPGLPPVPASHITIDFHDPNGETYEPFISMFRRMAQADGLIVSTFEAMERRAVHALKTEGAFPPIYCIGPLMSPPNKEKHACLTWLDSQPKGSVVFVCFGSMGTFSVEQLKEVAVGLEQSRQRFLWVVRNPTGEEKPLEALLPEGFIERNEGRGMVVKSWVPQVAVLSHEAVGGFVSHCGWNSTLEAVSSGVPMIAWPLFGEQWLNKVILVEAAKVAVEMEGYDKEMVRGEEVERKVRWLVESEGGKKLKDRVVAMKKNAMAATMEGGSSYLARRDLMEAIKNEGL